MTYETLHTEMIDGVLELQLDRPEQLNAFTVQMARELVDAFDRASMDDDVAAVVVTGNGRAFCAGMDLSADGNVFGLDASLEPTLEGLHTSLDDPRIVEGVLDTGGRVALAIHRCTKPVIGAINGAAVGIGATMTLPMDVRIAADTARIGFVFGRLGVVPEACSTWFLPRLVGISQALQWVYRAEPMGAEEALAGGLVQQVVPADVLLDTAHELAHAFTDGRSPVATALARRMLWSNHAAGDPLEAHKIESLAMFYTSRGDGTEGVQAFQEKRAPTFTARVSTDMPPFYPW